MFAIFRKEISGFFSSLTGTMVIILFLLVNSLFMWIFPGELNILDSGYAGLDTLFFISPWVFLFLVPAVTMKMIAEEKRLGTIELLFSRPVTERQIIWGKFLASVSLVLLALLPCLISFFSVYALGETPGNLDKGGTLGAFIGLFFLAAIYASSGLFASSLTDNQVIAFMLAVLISFLLFMGFDSFAYLPGLRKFDESIAGLGINEHYKSISRGVVDLRDIAYFIAVSVIFNEATRLVLLSRKWRKTGRPENAGKETGRIRFRSYTEFALLTGIVILFASASGLARVRLDLTEDSRYTLSDPTRKILTELDKDVYIQVYLDGDMPIPMKRLRRSVIDMLEEFRIGSRKRIDYEFINPADAKTAAEREARYAELIKKGLNPVNLMASDEEGGASQKMIFPGMIFNCNGAEVPLDFLRNNQSESYEKNILHSVEALEYEMIQVIATVSADTIYKVAFLEGHGELSELEVADATRSLAKYFTVDRGKTGGQLGILDNYSAVIIAGPTREFSESDKLVIDQYIMNGGKVLWLLEEVFVNSDSLASSGETVGLYYPLNIEDQLFRYGARINPEIIQDIECMVIPLTVLTGPENRQIVPTPWIYYPRLTPVSDHPVTRNLNRVAGKFVNTIDTVGLDRAIKKKILLTTSQYSRTVSPPAHISLREVDNSPSEAGFTRSNLPAAVLLEGVFPSAFRNRMTGSLTGGGTAALKTTSKETRMIVVADADIIRNEIQLSGSAAGFYPISKDRFTGEMLGNRDFIVNCVNYLVDDNGLMQLRSREVKMRLLDKHRIRSEAAMWQAINTAGPVIIVILAGLLFAYFRKRKYSG
jgi:ABC-2 type transport system permease protein